MENNVISRDELFEKIKKDKDNNLTQETKQFLEAVKKEKENFLKDIVLYVYFDGDMSEGNKLVDELNELCKYYRKNEASFFIYIFSEQSQDYFKGIDKTNNLLDTKEVSIDGIYSRANIFHYKYDKETFYRSLPFNKSYMRNIKYTDKIIIIEYYEKEYRKISNRLEIEEMA